MRVVRLLLLIAAPSVIGAPAVAAQATANASATPAFAALAPKTAADSSYVVRLAAVQPSDTTPDALSALRRQYALTSFYAPYSTSTRDVVKRMWARLDAKDFVGAGATADSILASNFVDFEARIGAGISADERGDSAAAMRHFAIARGIIGSIQSTGDGRTSEHPLLVLSVPEEYAYLNAMGLRRSGMQALVECTDKRECDLLEVTPRKGRESFSLYFDISLMRAYQDRQFRKSDKPR